MDIFAFVLYFVAMPVCQKQSDVIEFEHLLRRQIGVKIIVFIQCNYF